MSIICWNCRGIGNGATVRELRNLTRQFAPSVLCVLETQVVDIRVERLQYKLGFDHCYAVSSDARSSVTLDNGRHVWLLEPNDSMIVPWTIAI